MAGFSNDFTTWATGVGANTVTAALYAAAIIRQQGAQDGLADPITFNTFGRQASTVSTMITQFTADWGPGNVLDNGNVATLEAQFIAALTALIDTIITPAVGSFFHSGGGDSGTSGHYVLTTPSPALASMIVGTTVVFKPAHNSVGSDDLAVGGLAAIALVREDGSAIQAGDITTAGYPVVSYDGTHWVLLTILQTVAGVPVATTVANGIAREATPSEQLAGITVGSVPAFDTPEGVASYAEPRWTVLGLTSNHTETVYNQFIELAGSTNFTVTLLTSAGVSLAYMIWNNSTVNQNIAAPVGGTIFVGPSDMIGGGATFLVLPPGAVVFLRSDTYNWCVLQTEFVASTLNRGLSRLANGSEAIAGATSLILPAPAFMSPENVAAFFFAQIATTSLRGIAREATPLEMTNNVTTGSAPAFVTPEGLGSNNPFTKTGPGAVIVASTLSTGQGAPASVGGSSTWAFSASLGLSLPEQFTITVGSLTAVAVDNRWPTTAPPGIWMLIQASLIPAGQNYAVPAVFYRVS